MKLLSAFTDWNKQFNDAAERRRNEAGHTHAMERMTSGALTPDQVLEMYHKKFEATNSFNLGAVRAAHQYKQMLALVLPPKKIQFYLTDFSVLKPIPVIKTNTL